MRNYIWLLTILLTSCLGEVKSTKDSQEYEANVKLAETLESVEGVYEGRITPDPSTGAPFPVRLDITVQYEPNGKNSDGETKFAPKLQAYYQRLDIEDARSNYFIKDVRFYQETGDLVLFSPEKNQGSVPGEGYLLVKGQLEGSEYTALVYDHRGFLGLLKATRVR